MSGRRNTYTLALPDKPGQLNKVSKIFGDLGGNILDVYHSISDPDMAVNSCYLKVSAETRDSKHADEIRKALLDAGLILVD